MSVESTVRIVAAYASHNALPQSELPALISAVYNQLQNLGSAQSEAQAPAEPQKPAVPIKKSVTPDAIICLEDGKAFKSLKRHLGVHYKLTPDAYREKWGLPADYPMVAPNYAAARSQLAKTMSLGRKPGFKLAKAA